jgi:glycosyltransferase involved in cell wall biosynthesis
MDASVIICTRNRAPSLARALASIERANCPAGFTWELVVVDNGSTDDTAAVLADFSVRGVAAARGRYLIWTDDDVMVEPDWLSAYAAAFARWPEAAVFGGKILPVLEEPVSPWFAACQHEFSELLAKRDFGGSPLPLSFAEGRFPFGANFAVRAAEQRRFLFDPALGPAPGQNRVGEETQVLRAILNDGNTGYYLPNAVVRHMISPSRQTTSYVRSRYQAHGHSLASEDQRVYRRSFAGSPLWLWRQLATEAASYWLARTFSSPSVWVPHLRKHASWQGYARALRDRSGE